MKLSALKPNDSFKECENCPEMVVVPAGTFLMGSSDGTTKVIGLDGLPKPGDPPPAEEGHENGESPLHEVAIARPFAVGKFLVTFAEWDACVADGGCGGYRPSGQFRGSQPVFSVGWDDAKAYIAWLSKKTRAPYRLLSEAEREYVAKIAILVGGPPISVHGKVWEWVEDCVEPSYTGAPNDGSAWIAGNCRVRVRRGGSPRAASRNWYDLAGVTGTFRVARTITP